MLEVPSRDALAALTQAINAIAPSATLGLSRSLADGHVEVLYSDAHGIGAFEMPIAAVPGPLRPTAGSGAHADAPAADAGNAVAWYLAFAAAQQIVSVPIPGHESTRLWIGLADPRRPGADEIRGLESVAARAHDLFDRPRSDADQVARLQRLDMAAGLLPALMPVLDI